MQKWKSKKQVYERVGDEESSEGFPARKTGGNGFPGIKFGSFVLGVLVAGLMAACTAGIILWPTRIQAAQLEAYKHSHHSDHSAHDVQLEHSEHANSGDHDYSPSPQSKDYTISTCGSTLEEAKALNCEWDVMAAGWLPPACIDRELTEEFRAEGPWRYFADQNGTEELLEEELQYRLGEGNEYYASLRFHKTHCGYQWRKMHRAMQRGTKIENKLADYHHTLHCGYVNMQEGDLEDLLTIITVELMSC